MAKPRIKGRGRQSGFDGFRKLCLPTLILVLFGSYTVWFLSVLPSISPRQSATLSNAQSDSADVPPDLQGPNRAHKHRKSEDEEEPTRKWTSAHQEAEEEEEPNQDESSPPVREREEQQMPAKSAFSNVGAKIKDPNRGEPPRDNSPVRSFDKKKTKSQAKKAVESKNVGEAEEVTKIGVGSGHLERSSLGALEGDFSCNVTDRKRGGNVALFDKESSLKLPSPMEPGGNDLSLSFSGWMYPTSIAAMLLIDTLTSTT